MSIVCVGVVYFLKFLWFDLFWFVWEIEVCFIKGYKRCYKIKFVICFLNKVYYKICYCCFVNVFYYKFRISIVYVKWISNIVFWYV